eukprot:6490956-Amphidinium_carterae.1
MALWSQIRRDGLGSNATAEVLYTDSRAGREAFLRDAESCPALMCKGSKTSASRWFSWHSAFSQKSSSHHAMVLTYLLLAVRKGWVAGLEEVQGTDLEELEKRAGSNAEEDDASTQVPGAAASSSAAAASEAAGAGTGVPIASDRGRASLAKAKSRLSDLRSKTKHTIVLALRLMLDDDVVQSCRLIAIASKAEHNQYVASTRICRSSAENMKQLVSDSTGGWTAQLAETWGVLTDKQSLEWAGICTAESSMQRLRSRNKQFNAHQQSHASEQLGLIVTNILSHRACSLVELSTFPLAISGVLSEHESVVTETLAALKRACTCMAAIGETDSGLKRLVYGSQLGGQWFKWLTAMCASERWQALPEPARGAVSDICSSINQSRVNKDT